MRFAFPALLSDVGGTNARFRLLASPDAAPSPMVRLGTGGFAGLAEAAEAAVVQGGWPRPASLLIGAAGAVADRRVTLTNANWTIDGPAVAARLGLSQGLLLNDFEALALALPALGAGDTRAIGPDVAGAGLRLVIGPGTGLGVGALADFGGRHLPMSSEGGHIRFPAETAADGSVWQALGFGAGGASAERLLAGPALPALYHALGGKGDVTPAEVADRALAGGDGVARATLDRWLDLIARFSADMALTFLAAGGVYLGGGILPKLAGLIDDARFRAVFADNPVHGPLLSRLPVRLIVAEEPAMLGLAALARAPERYCLDFAGRCWRQP